MKRKVLIRLFKESILTITVASAWTSANWYTTASPTVGSAIKDFSAAVFFIAWLQSQFLRVDKQVEVEESFGRVMTRVEDVSRQLQQHTTDYLGYTTGGDSYVSFVPMLTGKNHLVLGLANESRYPVHDIQTELLDLDERRDGEPVLPANWGRNPRSLDSLFPARIALDIYRFELTERDRIRLNLFIRTRGTGTLQELRGVHLPTGSWALAVRTRVGNDTVSVEVPDNVPGWDRAEPDAIFA